MRILITGTEGFLGSAFEQALGQEGHVIIGTSRREGVPNRRHFDLLDRKFQGDLQGVEAVLHLAYSPRPEDEKSNIEGTQALFRKAKEDGVTRQILFSSYSASRNASTAYGRSKYILEDFFLTQGGEVVRPGLVAGPGGLFQRIFSLVTKFPLCVPLIGSGKGVLPFIALSDLVLAVKRILESEPMGAREYNLFSTKLLTLRELVELLLRKSGASKLVVPVPLWCALAGAWSLEFVGLTPPISSESIRAFGENQRTCTVSHLSAWVQTPQSLESVIEDLERCTKTTRQSD